MGKKYSKKEAVSIAISAARLYRDNLAGKKLLFVVSDKHKNVSSLEVQFNASNFHHLTGLKLSNPNCSHLDFYNLCIDGRLKESDIYFSEDGTTHQKLSVLLAAFKNPNLSASMMGNYNKSHPLLFTEKLVGGVRWAIGFRDVSGNGNYLPDTLLEGDIRANICDTYRILATYIKNSNEESFEKLIYKAKTIAFEELHYPENWGNRPKITDHVD